MVLLTLLSIVQALALEFLWGEVRVRGPIDAQSLTTVISWLQVAVAFVGIVVIWLVYASIVMRFRWVPTTGDSIAPFIIGVLEFMMIDNASPETLGRWFLLLGLVFAVVVIVGHHTMRRARRDPDNAEFFETLAPATFRDFYATFITVSGFLIAGIWFWVVPERGVLALLALIVALAVLLQQIRASAGYWRQSMGEPPK